MHLGSISCVYLRSREVHSQLAGVDVCVDGRIQGAVLAEVFPEGAGHNRGM